MEINDKEVTALDLLNLAFIGTAIEPLIPRIAESKEIAERETEGRAA